MPPVNSKGKRNGTGYEDVVANKCTALDFERFIQEHKTLILNDPLRDILLYPSDDVSCVVLPRRWRTVSPPHPAHTADPSPGSLLARQALRSYSCNWHVLHYKYSCHSGPDLAQTRETDSNLPEEVFAIDAEPENDDDTQNACKVDVETKEGYLLKGPEIGSDRIFGNLASKSFKKRYCSLVREADGTYVLEVYKDDKKTDTKLTIVMDFCSEVVRNAKRARFGFELRMSAGGAGGASGAGGGGGKGYSFAAETQLEMDAWVAALSAALNKSPADIGQQNEPAADKGVGSEPVEPVEPPAASCGTLRGLEHSSNPLLARYARETHAALAAARDAARRDLLPAPPTAHAPAPPDPPLEPYKEHFGQRILLKCESLKFRLQAPIDGERELLCQVEPYYTRLALFDVRSGAKLTEDFHFDVNHAAVRHLAPHEDTARHLLDPFTSDPQLQADHLPDDWLRSKTQALVSVSCPHADIFVVVRVDKLLQGPVSQVLEPYLRATKDPRLGLRVHRAVQSHAARLAAYRMPFAWAAKPLFRLYSNELDCTSEFPALYKQDPNKLSDEDLLKVLSDYRKPEKMAKLTVIPGWLSISIQQSNEPIPNCMSSSMSPLKPFPLPPAAPLTVELCAVSSPAAAPAHPHAAPHHRLYVRPLHLQYESQRTYARARNIACTVQLRDSDAGDVAPLAAVYGRGGMASQHHCCVIHHNASPAWCDEVKIRLPSPITAHHHLLFTFRHISCDVAKKHDANLETCIGYSWVPLLKNNRFVEETVNLPIATHLPSGYLSIQPLGLGKGHSGPGVSWVEGERQLFRCQLLLHSTLATRDPALRDLFALAERLVPPAPPATPPPATPPPWSDVSSTLAAARHIRLHELIGFLPTIFNQLFELMGVESSYSAQLRYHVVRLAVHLLHALHRSGREELLHVYVKYVFNCAESPLHVALTAPLHQFLEPDHQDAVLAHQFLQYSGFFFDIVVKSMAQYLMNTGRIKMSRHERFGSELAQHVARLVAAAEPAHLLQQPADTHVFNNNLAHFLKSCLSFMDRGFVFSQIKKYLDKFSGSEARSWWSLKLSFLQTVCAHEHYVSLNLPLLGARPARCRPDAAAAAADEPAQLKLSEEFVNRHFLAGTLLQHVAGSLRECAASRGLALGVLRALLAAHERDARYRSRAARARLALLYAPLLTLVLGAYHSTITHTTQANA